MKTALLAAFVGFGALVLPQASEAAGCLKGAAVGGVAGHYAGHHGVLGAAAGCVVGRHEANKHERQRQDAARTNDRATPN